MSQDEKTELSEFLDVNEAWQNALLEWADIFHVLHASFTMEKNQRKFSRQYTRCVQKTATFKLKKDHPNYHHVLKIQQELTVEQIVAFFVVISFVKLQTMGDQLNPRNLLKKDIKAAIKAVESARNEQDRLQAEERLSRLKKTRDKWEKEKIITLLSELLNT